MKCCLVFLYFETCSEVRCIGKQESPLGMYTTLKMHNKSNAIVY